MKEVVLITEKISVTLAIAIFIVISGDRNTRIVGEMKVVIVEEM
jgi:hypothetical protein